MRTPPGPPPPIASKGDSGMVVQTRRYRLITPLFGGGVEPSQPDQQQPVSGKAVRGQLRFWWRATRGGFGTVSALKRAEDKLWGSTARPSRIGVAIEEVKVGEQIAAFQTPTRGGRAGVPAYAAFPLRESGGRLLSGTQFVLEIRYPVDSQRDVLAALWAWETFGGLGARTRRGFGALRLVEVDGTPFAITDPQTHVATGLIQHVVDGTWPPGVPHLSRNLRFKITPHSWEGLIRRLQSFRQSRSGSGGRGRSEWPEADEIRRITSHWHRDRGHEPQHAVTGRKFPRAVFGLPIVFHFKDGPRDSRDTGQPHLDPYNTTLQGVESDRLASPLILRPLECQGGTVGLAAILEGPRTPPGGLQLRGPGGDTDVSEGLTTGDARAVPPLRGNRDVLGAFLESLLNEEQP